MTDAISRISPTPDASNKVNSPAQVLMASLVGTTIEFFDFYVYATAAVLVFPTLFFPNSDPTTALLSSFATFSIAFFARPFGAVVFGHFGDRIGRKTTLVAALLTMGISTVVIGLLPSYEQIGVVAPLLLALCRFGQGFGLGGEWGGAVLLATENAPEGKKSWYGMFPQLGAPVGLFLSSGIFWLLLQVMSQEALLSWGWRVPFIASIILIVIGLWVRLSITETPDFQKAIDSHERVAVPVAELFANHKRSLLLGTFVALATFVLFYIGSAYLLSYNVKVLKIPFLDALEVQILGSIVFGIFIPIVGKLADPDHRADRPLLLLPARPDDRRRRLDLRLRDLRHGADGHDLRPDRHGARRALPHRRALHRLVDHLQPCRHLRGVAGALHRHLAAGELRHDLCRLLPRHFRRGDAGLHPRLRQG